MSKCTNIEFEKLLHVYENNQLSEDINERFEIHLMECEHCFNEVRQFDEIAELMSTDVDVRHVIREAATEEMDTESIWEKFRRFFWPDKTMVLRPAIAYMIILLLIYPAYKGLIGTGDGQIKEIRSLQLVPDRSSDAKILKSGDDILLSFVFRDAEIDKKYNVIIISDNGNILFQDNEFSGFDKFQTGKLLLPANNLRSGEYSIIIEDPHGKPPFNKQEYLFTVE